MPALPSAPSPSPPLRVSAPYLQNILDTIRDPMLLLDAKLRVVLASRAFCQIFQATPCELEGQLFYELSNGLWNIPPLRKALDSLLPERSSFDSWEVTHHFPGRGQRILRLQARPIWPDQEDVGQILLVIEDLTASRAATAELQRINEMYRRLLSSSTDCIKLLGLDGCLLSLSESGRRELGLNEGESVLGSCWLDFWPAQEDQAACAQALQTACQGGIAEFEGSFTIPNGEIRWWHVVVSPILGLAGQPEFLLAVSRNITERKRAEERLAAAHASLQQLAHELKRSNDDLENFARMAGHDLRAPLNTIVQFSQLLSRRAASLLDEEGRDYLQYITEGGRRMSELLTGLLHFAMLAHTPQNLSPVVVQDACRQACDNLTAALHNSGATLHCEVPPAIQVLVENSRLVQLFQNLISNSIQYSRPAIAPVIVISAQAQGDEWLICVQDNGLGIEKQYWESIFEPFRRLHGKNIAGSGIGLATCQRIIERAGGKIWVESVPNQGSRFSVLLPQR